ncbi:hypothetical protein [Segeticoccus rhizosphaerae]|uniref:hypothetical protein n=1 Tax=Segeticoccus rhizosphaerae TaxID=1104777 RepID=UPI0010C05763|nr:hypothetical protein [Ornithinicoccus soli]
MNSRPANPYGRSYPDSEGLLEQACAHLDRAARQIRATAGDDPFAPARSLGAQLSLLCGGLYPGIHAVPDPDDSLGPLEHLDTALALLDAIPLQQAPPDLMVWTLRLAQLRSAVDSTARPTGTSGTDTNRSGLP